MDFYKFSKKLSCSNECNSWSKDWKMQNEY